MNESEGCSIKTQPYWNNPFYTSGLAYATHNNKSRPKLPETLLPVANCILEHVVSLGNQFTQSDPSMETEFIIFAFCGKKLRLHYAINSSPRIE